MSEPEVRRAGVFQRVKSQDLKLVEAAEVLGLSYRPAKRQYGGHRQGGSQALVHGNAGKPSNQAKRAKVPRPALALVKKHYGAVRIGCAIRVPVVTDRGGRTADAGACRKYRPGPRASRRFAELTVEPSQAALARAAGRQATAGNPETARGAAAEASAPHHPWRTSPAVTPWR